MSERWQDRVLTFWFGLDPKHWFSKSDEFDHRIREDFLDLWTRERELPAESFVTDARDALAAVILFDQFPRNMFRGHADQFSTDHLALQIAKIAVDRGFDETLSVDERAFLYLPFEHSEALADQERSLLLFTALGNDLYLNFAKKHRDIIQRFGRFPHRNQMLGRATRAEETEAAANPF